ncbi:MAG TPA: 3',5'-cyclic-AMP phosphodiesterase [Sedimenticola thiotaurini]|uniref:3',5'-cyclic-AMP phosphodiesterase n=1 Tax=Sedimenticola thiotaurini TaxID=1543721 RepID=A0A831RP65_9GAMM|nr:3',5'-cyclic-AMP phosphodiesterase [Sedimenticola thiotaurini]
MSHQAIATAHPLQPLPPGAFRILQITDSHLYADPHGCLAGINTLQSFQAVLEQARALPAEMILATGDLVHDASPEGYQRVRDAFAALGLPVYCLPGNHDLPAVMSRCLDRDGITSPKLVSHGDWAIFLLDSTIPGEEGGRLAEEELDRLEQGLEQNPGKHALICLHHHPVPVGSAWMDRMALENPERFFGLLQRFPNVRGILWGHIHQTYDATYRDMRLMGSPSTCIQFTPRVDHFAIDNEPPGMRWLELFPDGRIRTGVQRLQRMPLGLDLSSVGY